jgi:hypothetical protein
MELNATPSASTEEVGAEREEIPHEILVVITAAAAVFLRKRLRIRSLELLRSPHDSVSRWTRQGRASVQASHYTRPKR